MVHEAVVEGEAHEEIVVIAVLLIFEIGSCKRT